MYENGKIWDPFLPARKYEQEIRAVNYCCVTINFCGVEAFYDGLGQKWQKNILHNKYFGPTFYLWNEH